MIFSVGYAQAHQQEGAKGTFSSGPGLLYEAHEKEKEKKLINLVFLH